MNRRKFLKFAGASLGIAAITGGAATIIAVDVTESDMHPPRVADGEVLCDLHAHPANYWGDFETYEMLSSPGLIGLCHGEATTRNLTYESVLERFGRHGLVQEITPGQSAKIGTGYVCKAQEIHTADESGETLFHMLAIGFSGDYFPDGYTPEDTMKMVHDAGGEIGVAHPFVRGVGGFDVYRLLNEKEEERLRNLYTGNERPGFIGKFNAHLIDISAWKLKKANFLAEDFAEELDIPGIDSSDAHRRIAQCKMTGIGISKDIIEGQGMPGVVDAIVDGNFTSYGNARDGPYVPAPSFLAGMRYEQMCGNKWCGGWL